MTKEVKQPGWKLVGFLAVMLLAITLILYQHTTLYLASLWNNLSVGEYAHGYLVVAISAYLIFSKREALSKTTPYFEYRALLGIIASGLLWMLAALVDVEMVQAIALLLLILFITWTVLGNQAIKVLAFPILFIAFAIPVWFPLSPLLQNIAADSVFWAIRMLSVPALRQDNMIVLPAGTLSVEEACSGLRYLLAALTLGTLYAYMNYKSLRARIMVVLVSAVAAIIGNIVRVFVVVYLAYTTEMQHPLVHDHLSLGWYLFGGIVVVLLFVDARIYKHQQQAVKQSQPAVNDAQVQIKASPRTSYYFMLVIACGLLVSVAPVVVYKVAYLSNQATKSESPHLPQNIRDWSVVVDESNNWAPLYHGAVNLKQTYQKDNQQVVLYVGYYASQKQGDEVINDLNRIFNKEYWRKTYPHARVVEHDGAVILEQLLEQRKGRQQRLVWYWYNIANWTTTNKYEAKLMQVIGLLSGRSDAYVMAVSVEKINEDSSSKQVLKDFLSDIENPVLQY